MSRELSELRVEIDQIDRQIVELIRQRMMVANEVAEYKRERDLPVLDSGREQALLSKVTGQAGEEFSGGVRAIYHTILSASRSYQNVKLDREAEIYQGIKRALEKTELSKARLLRKN